MHGNAKQFIFLSQWAMTTGKGDAFQFVIIDWVQLVYRLTICEVSCYQLRPNKWLKFTWPAEYPSGMLHCRLIYPGLLNPYTYVFSATAQHQVSRRRCTWHRGSSYRRPCLQKTSGSLKLSNVGSPINWWFRSSCQLNCWQTWWTIDDDNHWLFWEKQQGQVFVCEIVRTLKTMGLFTVHGLLTLGEI